MSGPQRFRLAMSNIEIVYIIYRFVYSFVDIASDSIFVRYWALNVFDWSYRISTSYVSNVLDTLSEVRHNQQLFEELVRLFTVWSDCFGLSILLLYVWVFKIHLDLFFWLFIKANTQVHFLCRLPV